MNELGSLMDWISNQGFAIAVASYFIIRLDQKLDKLITLVERLAQ